MKKYFAILALLFTASCGDDIPLLPVGYELVASDGNFHFVYITPEFIGNKVSQREVGKIICAEIFKTPEYCEVWYWSKKDEIPKGFPVINRKSIIGLYQMKGDKIKLKALTGTDSGNVVDLSKRQSDGAAITNLYKVKGKTEENTDEEQNSEENSDSSSSDSSEGNE